MYRPTRSATAGAVALALLLAPSVGNAQGVSPAPATQPTNGPSVTTTAPPVPTTPQTGTPPTGTPPTGTPPPGTSPSSSTPPGGVQSPRGAQTQPGTQPQTQPGTQSPAQPGTQPQTQPQTQPGTQPQTQPGTTGTGGTGPNGTTGGTRATGGAGGTSGSAPVGTGGPQGLPPPPMPPVLPPVPNVAPGYTAPSVGSPPGDLVGVNQLPFVGITLDNAIAMGLARNTDLALAQANRRIAGFQIIAAQGAYDVRFQVQPSYEHAVSAPLSPFQAGPNFGPITQDLFGVTSSLSGQTVNGHQYRLSVSGQRVTTNSTATGYNPYYPTAISLNVTQPLLRGLATDETRRQLLLARVNASTQSDIALTQASQAIVNISNAYWDLVAAWRNVAIQEEGLRQAQAQAQSNQRLARAGQVAPVDIVEANTQVNVFQANIFSALENVQRLQTQIKSLILANPADPLWMANLVPTSGVRDLPPEPAVADVIAQAIRNRPELAQIRDQRHNADINVAFARDQLKPQLDLQLGFTTNGFAGLPTDPTQNPLFAALGPQVAALNTLLGRAGLPPLAPTNFATPSYLTGHVNQSFANLFSNRFPTYSAQLLFTIPLGNRTAKANFAASIEQERSVTIQETALLQRFKSEAYNAIQTLRETRYRLDSARAAREASERVLLSEQRRFRIGTSTTFLVLQRQLDLANNRGRELQAQTDLNKAVVELSRVTGAIFGSNGIDVTTLGEATRSGVQFDPRTIAPNGASRLPTR